MRVYTLSVGATLPAISVVLAGFMLGLGSRPWARV
jgi:hypothetical protein